MSTPEELSIMLTPTVQLFEKSEASWEKIRGEIDSLNEQFFGKEYNIDKPVLGGRVDGEDITAYPDWRSTFLDEATSVVILRDPQNDKKIIGYTFAVPIDKMDPRRENESNETAYIYTTAIAEEYQRTKKVGPLTDHLY